jgi:hypothetical protein
MDILHSPIRCQQDDFGRNTDKLNWLGVQPRRITPARGASQSKKLMRGIKEIYPAEGLGNIQLLPPDACPRYQPDHHPQRG